MEHVSSIMEREVVLEADLMNQGYGNESLRDWEAVIEGLHRFPSSILLFVNSLCYDLVAGLKHYSNLMCIKFSDKS